jgi:hypothetical protein
VITISGLSNWLCSNWLCAIMPERAATYVPAATDSRGATTHLAPIREIQRNPG